MLNKNEIVNPRKSDLYPQYEKAVKDNFNSVVDKDTNLFFVNVEKEKIWKTYLDSLPEEARQHYNCNNCKHFFQRYGNLVYIDDNGEFKSPLWIDNNIPPFFKQTNNALRNLIEKDTNKINRVFITDERILGVMHNHIFINCEETIWTHFNVTLPKNSVCINTSRLLSAGQVSSNLTENYKIFNNALREYNNSELQVVIDLLESGSLYRGNKLVNSVKWFKDTKELIENSDSKVKNNLKWLAVALAPNGFVNIKSSVVGSLLDDIIYGYDTDILIRRFNNKTDSTHYMRSTSEPSLKTIESAEKVIIKMGLENALERRFATMDDIPEEEVIWKPQEIKTNDNTDRLSKGVFASLKQKRNNSVNIPCPPTTTMTWEKFKRTILPNAVSIEARVDNENRLMALVTENIPNSERLFPWNNPVSWYYHTGVDSEIKRRVEENGGKYENNAIRCSLLWNNYTDLDIHCITPIKNEISYHTKRADNGYLDIDMNAMSHRCATPIENIRFDENALNGVYTFYVHNYCDRNYGDNKFKVELEVNGKIFTYEGNAKINYKQTIFKFKYENGQIIDMLEGENNYNPSNKNIDDWNLAKNQFTKVNALVKSPNMWGENNYSNLGEHVFFILDDCKDSSEGKGRIFFNEMLISDLKPIRKTLEAYTRESNINGYENSNACGLGFSNNNEWNLTLRVKTKDDGNKMIKIDRFD